MGLFGNLFGRDKKVTQPTTYQTLPGFARQGLEQATQMAQGFAQNPDIFAPSALTQQQQQALGVLGQQVAPIGQEQFNTALGTFMNPYVEQALQPTFEDIRRQGQSVLSDIGSGATAAGGFGGTRQALLEAEAQKNVLSEIGRIGSQARAQAFNDAANRALSEIGRQGQAAATLFDVGSILQGQQTQARQAPISAAQFLAQIAGQAPAGGGGISYYDQKGALQRIGEAGQGLATIGRGLTGMGGF